MDERWPGSLFQTLEATDENDLDLAILVFRVGIHSDNEDYLGPFGVLWVHMAWHKNCVKKKKIAVIVLAHTVE